jgi:amidohydrolase
MPVGSIMTRAGAMLPGAGIFTVDIEGKGGHAARPNTTIDPVVAAAQMTTALQSIVSRNVDPLDAAVLSVTQISAGEAFNVIPQKASFKGTFRTFTPKVRDYVMARFTELVEGIAGGMGCTAEIYIEELVPPVVNNAGVVDRLDAVFLQTDFQYHTDFRSMVSEDMAYFLREVPGAYLFVGCGPLDYALHHPQFNIDEDVLEAGTAILAAAVSDYVLPD